jgi:hypothetical protein
MIALALGLIAMPPAADAGASWDCSNRLEDALPADAYFVTPPRAGEMQALLAEHHRIRLQPGADYRRATGVTLHSGEAIYGAAGSRMGRLVVAPGTTGAIVSGVVPEALEFPASAQSTHGNCFERFAVRASAQRPLTLSGAVVEDNLFLDAARVVIDTHSRGKVDNNRFLRVMVHGEAPAINIIGKPGEHAGRNIFLWTNVLGAIGDGILASHQAEINFIGFDAENWNQRHLAQYPAMMSIFDSGTVRAAMAHGGDPKTPAGRFMDIAAQRFELLGMRLLRAGTPAIVLRPGVRAFLNALSTDASIEVDAPESARLSAYSGAGALIERQGSDAVLPVHERSASPWPAPRFAPIANPAGHDWARRRTSAHDSRAELQQLIDAHGLVWLPAGTYYVSGPLHLHDGQGLIGAGAGRTALVAQSADIDLIVGDDRLTDKHATSFALVDITLQGGRAGIRHDEHGAGAGAQFNLCYLSHVVFRDMSEAGIVVAGIYGWDNNLLDNLTFFRMPVGILQVPSTWYRDPAVSGDVAGMNYMDKNVCYRCRFDSVDQGLQLTARRANGLNACIDCRFENNRSGAVRLVNNLSTVIANSDFVNNGGDPELQSNFPVGVVGSRFVTGEREKSLLDSGAICEGCQFRHAGRTGATIASAGSRVVLLNSFAPGFAPGRGVSGLLVDSELGGGPAYRGRLVSLTDGRPTVLTAGEPQPLAQWLVSWHD